MSQDKPLPFVYQFAAGAVAGVSEILMLYPTDTVKTRAQLATGQNIGMISTFREIIRNEGVARLYRGITLPILMEAPKRATKFAANDAWGKFYRNAFSQEKMTQSLSVLTGATAGATESFIVVPFELTKIRLQDKASVGRYKGPIDVVSQLIRQDGVLALYQGLESTMWRHVLWNAGYFGCIFQVRTLLPVAETKSKRITNDIIAGSIGGTFGTILNTPFDVVKSKIQNTPKAGGAVPWAWPALIRMLRQEGWRSGYRGFVPKVARLGPGGGVLLVVYTAVIDFFTKFREGK